MAHKKIMIVGAVRTPIGAIGGGLSSLQAIDLATAAISSVPGWNVPSRRHRPGNLSS